jgi:hypothetical protein
MDRTLPRLCLISLTTVPRHSLQSQSCQLGRGQGRGDSPRWLQNHSASLRISTSDTVSLAHSLSLSLSFHGASSSSLSSPDLPQGNRRRSVSLVSLSHLLVALSHLSTDGPSQARLVLIVKATGAPLVGSRHRRQLLWSLPIVSGVDAQRSELWREKKRLSCPVLSCPVLSCGNRWPTP